MVNLVVAVGQVHGGAVLVSTYFKAVLVLAAARAGNAEVLAIRNREGTFAAGLVIEYNLATAVD